jgi:hypothetical protein
LIALSAATFLVLAGCAVDCSAACQAGNRELAAIPIPPSSRWHAHGGLQFTPVNSHPQPTRNRWYQQFHVPAPPSQIIKQVDDSARAAAWGSEATCNTEGGRAGCWHKPGWSLGIVAYPDSATQSWVRVTLTKDHAVTMP